MPFYEYRCRDCDVTFEQRRTMAEADAPSVCPDGHSAVVRLLPVFSSARSGGGDPGPTTVVRSGGGCGGACACG